MYVFYRFVILRWFRPLNDPYILLIQYSDCWWLGSTRSQGNNSHGTVFEISRLSEVRGEWNYALDKWNHPCASLIGLVNIFDFFRTSETILVLDKYTYLCGPVDVASHKSDWTCRLSFGLVGLVSHWSDWTSGQESFWWRLMVLTWSSQNSPISTPELF